MNRHASLDGIVPGLALAAAAIATAIAAVAIVGWHARMPILAQWVPGRIPMVYNTALAVIAAGVALVLRGRAGPFSGITVGAIVAGFGFVNLGARLLGAAPGLDAMFFAVDLDPALPAARMAPNTALGFAVLGSALIALARGGERGTAAGGFLGAVLGAIAAVTLVGHTADLAPAYDWWELGPMAIPTAAALMALSTSVVAGSAETDRARGERAPPWLAFAAGLGVFATFLILSIAIAAEGRSLLAAAGVVAGGAVAAMITILFRLRTLARRRARELEREIAERRRAEAALRESETLLRAILDTLPVGIWITDAKGVIREGNEAARAIWGGAHQVGIDRYPASKSWWAGTDRRIGAEESALARAVRSGESSIGELVDIEPFDGPRKTISSSAVPIRDAAGTIAGAVVVVQDVTEAVAAEREIRRLNAELEVRIRERTAHLEAALAELESFSYAVAHDLRQPLRAIDGFSLAIAEEIGEALPAEPRDWFERIRVASRRMGELIDDLLEFARLARAPVRREAVDLVAMARAVLEDLRRGAPDRVVELVAPDRLELEADPEMARIAIGHLIDNAWKFTAPHPAARIEIGEQAVDGERVVHVRDDGVGFEAAYRDKLFRPFERLHSRGEFPGSGIGLAMVKRIVERHGGRVWAESDVDRGATFFVTWGRDAPGGSPSASPADENCVV